MADLSIVIPARSEEWLNRTVQDVLAHARADTEVIAVLDGDWIDPPLDDHPKLHIVKTGAVIGQRAATNLGARLSTATYVMKLDAHCSVADGFDAALIQADQELNRPDVTQIPAMCNLHAFNWRCQACGHETYQGPTPTACESCKGSGPFVRVVIWQPRRRKFATSERPGDGREVRTEHWRFDYDLHFQYGGPIKPDQKGAELADTMSSVGACFFMRRARFQEIGGLDEAHGSWGQFGTEIACKSWLSGGRHVVNTRTWFAHLFRTQGAGFGFPYAMSGTAQEAARAHSRRLWLGNRWPGQVHPLSWLVDSFAPVRGWHEPEKRDDRASERTARLAEVRAAGERFLAGKRSTAA